MKYFKFFSSFIIISLLKVNAEDCNIVKNILTGFGYQIDQNSNCCNYSFNDQYTVSCDGNSVTGLSIINNPSITNIPNDILNLNKLEKLDFSNCQISQFPYILKNLSNFKSLYLWKNNISEITDEILEFKSLEHLDLGENGLKSIPENIGQMKKLNSLLLYNNDISTIPESIYQLNELQVLNLEGNQNLSGILNEFGNKVNSCNIKNTHLCIAKNGICGRFIVNNYEYMPFCNSYDGKETNLTFSTPSTSFSSYITISALLLIGAGAGFFIYKKRLEINNNRSESCPIEEKPIIKKSKKEHHVDIEQ